MLFRSKQGFCADFKTPWETEGAFPNIFQDGDKWRMYYMAGARIDMDRISKIDPSDKDKIRQVVDETIIDGFKICYMERAMEFIGKNLRYIFASLRAVMKIILF